MEALNKMIRQISSNGWILRNFEIQSFVFLKCLACLVWHLRKNIFVFMLPWLMGKYFCFYVTMIDGKKYFCFYVTMIDGKKYFCFYVTMIDGKIFPGMINNKIKERKGGLKTYYLFLDIFLSNFLRVLFE